MKNLAPRVVSGLKAAYGYRPSFQMVAAFAILALAVSPASATTAGGVTTIANSINSGFDSIFSLGQKVVGGIALVMALWWGFKWITGDAEAMKKCIGTGIAGIVVYNLKSIIALFGLS